MSTTPRQSNGRRKSSTSSIEAKTLKLSVMTTKRDSKRKQVESLFEQQQQIRRLMEEISNELQEIDAEIDECERDIQGDITDVSYEEEELLPPETDELIVQKASITMTMNPVEHLTELHDDEADAVADFYDDDHEEEPPMESPLPSPASVCSSPSSRKDCQLGISTIRNKQTKLQTRSNDPLLPSRSVTSVAPRDSLLQLSQVARPQQVEGLPLESHQTHLASNNFPWSPLVQDLLHNEFRLPKFRGYQKEIINSTLSGDDTFVIMRTGGGKSLTYQLPSLLEGRGPERKVTFVISPLLSLIQDQEEQMNGICPGSALSFSSGLLGGSTEHARRWKLVRDPAAGVCLVFVTPEKVSQSNKLRGELEHLHSQGRLGRFVIDECHCATMYGHDFRPDYTKLGVLKIHFPTIPVLAVTATASDRVRFDCCEILRIEGKYQFFRSTAHRPNLKYSVHPKPVGKDKTIDEMAAFVKRNHPRDAGIVYAFSRKDADDIASQLTARGIVAESYHSDVAKVKKERIHQSWMRNKTQVVCATIAFGLGINKPDVRFVLHHTLSKTIEAYYQESGRAGRDGNAADCVLYYSPKDVPRMIGMIEGKEGGFWPMVRYAQANGNDAICKSIIMSKLGEPNIQPIAEVDRDNSLITNDERDVGKHAQTLAKLLQEKMNENEKLTLPMLVKEWRAKNSPYQCVKSNPPGNELTTEESERIVISLLLEEILAPMIAYTAYSTVMYVVLGPHGHKLIASLNPKVNIRFPKRVAKASSTEVRTRTSIGSTDEGWTDKKPKAKRKATSIAKTSKSRAVGKAAAGAKKHKSSVAAKKSKPKTTDLVIELSSDESCEAKPISRLVVRKRASKIAVAVVNDALWDDPASSDGENEFQ